MWLQLLGHCILFFPLHCDITLTTSIHILKTDSSYHRYRYRLLSSSTLLYIFKFRETYKFTWMGKEAELSPKIKSHRFLKSERTQCPQPSTVHQLLFTAHFTDPLSACEELACLSLTIQTFSYFSTQRPHTLAPSAPIWTLGIDSPHVCQEDPPNIAGRSAPKGTVFGVIH